MQKLNLRKTYKQLRKRSSEIGYKGVDYAYNANSEIYEVPINLYRRAKRLLKKTRDIVLVNNYLNKYANDQI